MNNQPITTTDYTDEGDDDYLQYLDASCAKPVQLIERQYQLAARDLSRTLADASRYWIRESGAIVRLS